MHDIERTLFRRNARFRAWKEFGVPVEAVWRPWHQTYELLIRCTVCDNGRLFILRGGDLPWAREHQALNSILDESCTHLISLSEPDPPEVMAIYELELLAGDP